MKHLIIAGTRGIPAEHGGFETFAERLAVHMVERGWEVTVYCQRSGPGRVAIGEWNGVRTVEIGVGGSGPLASMVFDWRTVRHAVRDRGGMALTLGYNTAAFTWVLRRHGITNLINMDGLEWRRAKWSLPAKAWLYLNERAGIRLADEMVADHPEIARHLARHAPEERITMIPYGADRLDHADESALANLGLERNGYALVVARPERENSILEIVTAFSRRPRPVDLVVLGDFRPERKPYHAEVMNAASTQVHFPGTIYESCRINALRYFCRLYIHGHTVGGTNPSLVEALGAGSPVLAHDNRFNRWVAGSCARYFTDIEGCADQLDAVLDVESELSRMEEGSLRRHGERFTWERVLADYEALLERWA